MELSVTVIALLVGGALLAALAAVVLAAAALAGQRRVRRTYQVFSGGRRGDVLSLLAASAEQVEALRRDLDEQHVAMESLRGLVQGGISRVGAVHYDAFSEMGGRLSFSAALLDEHGDGLVLTSITGRTDSRTYLKPMLDGAGTRELSDEEQEAVDRALGMQGRRAAAGSPAGPAARGSRFSRSRRSAGAGRRPAVADAS